MQSLAILKKYDLTYYDDTSKKHDIIKPYLLYVGNVYPHKNLEALVDVLNQDALRGITLVLVGKEDYFYHRLKERVFKKEIKNILFVGFVPDNELDVLYRFGRAYVFPSLYEGFGLPPLEAMGRGLPVLAAHATSLPEVLGDAALYFYPDQADSLKNSLIYIWQEEAARMNLREKCYAQVNTFQWRIMAQKTLTQYESH